MKIQLPETPGEQIAAALSVTGILGYTVALCWPSMGVGIFALTEDFRRLLALISLLLLLCSALLVRGLIK